MDTCSGGVGDLAEPLRTQLGRFIGLRLYYEVACLDQYGRLVVRNQANLPALVRLLQFRLSWMPFPSCLLSCLARHARHNASYSTIEMFAFSAGGPHGPLAGAVQGCRRREGRRRCLSASAEQHGSRTGNGVVHCSGRCGNQGGGNPVCQQFTRVSGRWQAAVRFCIAVVSAAAVAAASPSSADVFTDPAAAAGATADHVADRE